MIHTGDEKGYFPSGQYGTNKKTAPVSTGSFLSDFSLYTKVVHILVHSGSGQV